MRELEIDDDTRGPVVLISVLVLGGLLVGCAGAVGLGLLGRSRGWW